MPQPFPVIPHNRPTLGGDESNAAKRVLSSGRVAQGKEVEEFEKEFCRLLGLPPGHAVAVSSGTAALFLALWALNARDKKIIMPAYVCSALRHAVSMAGAKEMLADLDENSPNIDINVINTSEADIAIVAHMYGLPADVSVVKKPLIEDCAQALGASINNVPVGLHGDVGIFSFYATKLITSGGQGGMLVSKKKALADMVRDYRQFDCRKDRRARFNFQMTDLQAAIGRKQLIRLSKFLTRRAQIFDKYIGAGIPLLDTPGHGLAPVRYRAVMKTRSPKKVLRSLTNAGIGAIVPINDWELLGKSTLFPKALDLARHTVSLPLYPTLSDKAVARIIAAVA